MLGAILVCAILVIIAPYISGRGSDWYNKHTPAGRGVVRGHVQPMHVWTATEYGAWAAKQLDGFSSAFNLEGVGTDILTKLNGIHPDNLTNEDFQAILNKNMGSR